MHGAFPESASWNGVIRRLQDQGYTAIAASNPLRSVSGDAEFLASILDSIEGPVVLVAHSNGGSVMSTAALGKDNVEALVFVAAFAPEEGESIAELSGRSPGGTLGETLDSVPLSDSSMHEKALSDRSLRRRMGLPGEPHLPDERGVHLRGHDPHNGEEVGPRSVVFGQFLYEVG